MSQRIIILFCAIILIKSEQYPDITPCRKDDTICLTRNSNILYKMSVAGDPSLNIENLDPMYQERIDGNLGIINYTFYNSTVTGFSECDVVNSKLNMKKSSLSFDLFCPTFKMHGKYNVTGFLIAVPIEGNGDYSVLCKDYHVHIDTEIKINQNKDGVNHLKFKNYKVDGELQGKMVTDLTNLFNGQHKKLAATVLRFINDNWKPVSKQLQGPVFKANVRKLIKNFNKYLKRIPLHQVIVQ